MKMTAREIDFLARLSERASLRLADREEDKVRQRMRRAGYAVVRRNPRRWEITEAGLAALWEAIR